MSDTYTEQMDSLLNPVSNPKTPSLPKEFIESFKNRNDTNHFESFKSSSVSSPLQKEIYDDWTETGAIAWAGYMGTIDSIRGVKQIVGWDRSVEEKDQELLNTLMEHPEWGGKIKAAWFGGMILDPVGWLVPVAKARTAGKMAYYGFKWGAGAGAIGYVDKESSGRLWNTISGAVSGAVLLGGGKKVIDIGRRVIKGKERFQFENVPVEKLAPARQLEIAEEVAKRAFPDEAVSVHPQFRSAKIIGQQGESIIDFTSQKTAKELLDNPQAAIQAFTGNQPQRLADKIKKFYFAPFQTAQAKYYDFTTNKLYKPVFGNPISSIAAASSAVAGMAISDEYIQTAIDRYEDENDIDTGAASQALIGLAGIISAGATLAAGKGLRKIPDKLGGDVVNTNMDKASYWFGRLFIDNYKLPPIYKQLKDDIGIDINSYQNRFYDIATKISKFTPDESRILYQFMDGQHRVGGIAGKIPKELDELGSEARELLKEVGQEMVDAGLLKKSDWEKNVDTYIHRTYIRKELTPESDKDIRKFVDIENETKKMRSNLGFSGEELKPRGIPIKIPLTDSKKIEAMEKLGAELISKGEKYAYYRKPLTKQQRKRLGEVEDAAYAVEASGKLMTNDLAVYKFYRSLKEQDLSMSPDMFKNIARDQRQYWVKLPNDNIKGTEVKEWGALAGQYVPKAIADDLKIHRGILKYTTGNFENPIADGLQRAAIGYRKWNRRWKKTKTIWNPTVHGHNTFSNFTVLDGWDVPVGYLSKYGLKVWTKAGQKTLNGDKEFGPIYDDLVRLNVFDSNLLKGELGMDKEDFLRIYAEETLGLKMNNMGQLLEKSSNIGGRVWETLIKTKKILGAPIAGADRLFGKWYQNEDAMFRAALYVRRLEEGIPGLEKVFKKGSPEYDDAFEKLKREAAALARKGFVDYDIQAPAIQLLRETLLPFLAYPYRMIPLLAEMATKKPHKFAKWAAMYYALDYMGSESSTMNEQFERGLLEERGKSTVWGIPMFPSSFIKVPHLPKEFEKFVDKRFDVSFGFDLNKDIITGKDIPNRSTYLDIQRILPAGDAIGQLSPGTGGGWIPGFPAWMQPSGGLAGDFMLSWAGIDPFTHKKFPKNKYGEETDLAENMHHFLKKLVPNNPIIGISGWQWGIDQIPGVELKARWRAFDSYAHKNLMETITQRAHARAPYAEDTTVVNQLLRFIGIKLWPFEPRIKDQKFSLKYERKIRALQKSIQDMEKELRKYRPGSEEYKIQLGKNSEDLKDLRRRQEEYELKIRRSRKLKRNIDDPREIWESQW